MVAFEAGFAVVVEILSDDFTRSWLPGCQVSDANWQMLFHSFLSSQGATHV